MLKDCMISLLLKENKKFLWHIYLSGEMSTFLVTNIFFTIRLTIIMMFIFTIRNTIDSCDKYICNNKC